MLNFPAIDVATEDLLDLNAARREPVFRHRVTKKPASLGKIYRLAQHGCKSVTGEKIRLEVLKTPSGFITSRAAIQRFVDRLSGTGAAPTPLPTSRARRERFSRAEAELVGAGFEIGGPTAA